MTRPATDPAATEPLLLRADRLLTPDVVLSPGWVLVEAGRVARLGAGQGPPGFATVTFPPGYVLAPGLVDMHVHGTGGADMTDGTQTGLTHTRAALARHGITACVASLVTAPREELERSLVLVADATTDGAPGLTRIVGAHLEGPFLSTAHRGAHHEPSLRDPDGALTAALLDVARGSVRMMTLAPELPGAPDVLAVLRERGVVAAMGHTAATFDQTAEALRAGISVATHLFNGMRAPHHREPGPAMSLLDDPGVVVELINDGAHVHPAVARIAARAAGAGRLALISDGVAATAAPPGEYRLGRVAIRSRDGLVETADGTSLGGGVVTLAGAVRRAVGPLGLDVVDAVRAATIVPARALGVADQVGALAAGRSADLVALSPDTRVTAVMVAGRWVVPPGEVPTDAGTAQLVAAPVVDEAGVG